MMPIGPYAPPASFDIEESPVARLWPGGLFLVPLAVSFSEGEIPMGLGWIKAVFPLVMFLALVCPGNASRIQAMVIIARIFSAGLVLSFLCRINLGFADVEHFVWVICFVTGSFLACHRRETAGR